MILDNNLKYCREELEMTLEEMGYVLGVTKGTVSNWENANDTIPLRQVIKICNRFDLSVDYVLGLTRENKMYSKIPELNKKEIGKNIKNLRIKLNLTQKALADDCSISQSALSKFESGDRLVNTLTLQTIAKKYKVSIDGLLNRK